MKHEISNQEMPFERKFLLWLGYKNYAIETITDKFEFQRKKNQPMKFITNGWRG